MVSSISDKKTRVWTVECCFHSDRQALIFSYCITNWSIYLFIYRGSWSREWRRIWRWGAWWRGRGRCPGSWPIRGEYCGSPPITAHLTTALTLWTNQGWVSWPRDQAHLTYPDTAALPRMKPGPRVLLRAGMDLPWAGSVSLCPGKLPAAAASCCGSLLENTFLGSVEAVENLDLQQLWRLCCCIKCINRKDILMMSDYSWPWWHIYLSNMCLKKVSAKMVLH